MTFEDRWLFSIGQATIRINQSDDKILAFKHRWVLNDITGLTSDYVAACITTHTQVTVQSHCLFSGERIIEKAVTRSSVGAGEEVRRGQSEGCSG